MAIVVNINFSPPLRKATLRGRAVHEPVKQPCVPTSRDRMRTSSKVRDCTCRLKINRAWPDESSADDPKLGRPPLSESESEKRF